MDAKCLQDIQNKHGRDLPSHGQVAEGSGNLQGKCAASIESPRTGKSPSIERTEATCSQNNHVPKEGLHRASPDREEEIEEAEEEILSEQKANEIQWIPLSEGRYPKDAFVAGSDSGKDIYVVRAFVQGSWVPGKLHSTHSCACFSHNSKEHGVIDYKVLVTPPSSLCWISKSGGSVPYNAVKGRSTSFGETYFIGRVKHNDTLTVGKIQPSHGVCYIPYGGKELRFRKYEVLKLLHPDEKKPNNCSIA